MAQLMLVEDNAFIREVLTRILGKRYRLQTYSNGLEAIEALQQDDCPDLLITDLAMPLMDGFALIAYVRARARFTHMPILVLSATHDSDTSIRCLELGADQYMNKPFNPMEIQAHIQALLRTTYTLKGLTPS